MDNRQQVINWVSQLVRDLTDQPEDLTFKATVDEKGLLVTVYVPVAELGRLIGKNGKNAESLRTIVNTYGHLHSAQVSLKLEDATK